LKSPPWSVTHTIANTYSIGQVAIRRCTCDQFPPGQSSVTTFGKLLTSVPLSPSSITWYWSKDGDVLQLEWWPQAWWKVMDGSLLPGMTYKVTCGLTGCTPGSAPGPTLGNEYGKLYTLPTPIPRVSSARCIRLTSGNNRLYSHRIWVNLCGDITNSVVHNWVNVVVSFSSCIVLMWWRH